LLDLAGVYTHGAYALKLLNMLIAEKKVKPTIMEAATKRNLRRAYVGGRNEFIQEPEPRFDLFSVDFTLMYFNCLKTNFLMGNINKKPKNQLDEPGFYYVRFESRSQDYPILYQYNSAAEQIYFCNGVGEGLF
jgi:hypothetical protein